ncbi:MAG: 2'-5' RNA ligase, partial [Planctomycetes bacterium RBG_13_63_9]
MKDAVRTFVAVEISSAVRERAGELIEVLRASGADVKWVEVGNLHLTLKFLGDVASREIPRVCEAVERGTAKVAPFELEVRGAGAFPDARRPRTVWLGVGNGAEEMVELHRHVEAKLSKLGYRKEHRRFQAHLTIGRVRGGGPAVVELGQRIEQQSDLLAGKMQVREVVVFSSQLDRSGPTYEAL